MSSPSSAPPVRRLALAMSLAGLHSVALLRVSGNWVAVRKEFISVHLL